MHKIGSLKSAAWIELSSIGSPELGYLTVAESSKNLPFNIQRVYWTYSTPPEAERGHHAHRDLEQILFAVAGEIQVTLEDVFGQENRYILQSPQKGLFVPKMYWRKLKFSSDAVLLCLASLPYDPAEYIRSYEEFRDLSGRIRESLKASL